MDELSAAAPPCPVNSFNEWDPLEEVIVGRLEHATIPSAHVTVTFTIPRIAAKFYRWVGGYKYPRMLTTPAQQELDQFIHILEAEGVRVRRPDVLDFSKTFRTPHWKSKGFTTACPRDGILVVGDELIETPMAWRTRHFEMQAYRSLFKEYFAAGARWTAAPRPVLPDELYDRDMTMPKKGAAPRFVVNEFEPVFDAADFVRCGRDLFVTRSNVTNHSGIEWLRRHLGDEYRIHEVRSTCPDPMHIDSTFMPIGPERVLVNPDYLDLNDLPPVLKNWEILVAPRPDPPQDASWRSRVSMCSDWISINFLMLDPKRVVVEKSQVSIIKAFKEWGIEAIPCAFSEYGPFGGSFHCATLDIRRAGGRESYA
jgi:glycine amidinotransferase